MNEINLIPLSTPNYPANGNLDMISTQAPGLQNSRDIAPIVVAHDGHTLPLHSAAEHNPPVVDERVETLVENQVQFQNREGDKIGKSGWFVGIFNYWQQL